jgi:hypothetical protein
LFFNAHGGDAVQSIKSDLLVAAAVGFAYGASRAVGDFVTV